MKHSYSHNIFLSIIFLFLSVLCLPSHDAGAETFTNLGIYGGQVIDIEIDPSNPDKMFAATYMGAGLYMTTDGGQTWEAVEMDGTTPGEDDFKNHKVFAVKIAPNNPDVVWAVHNVWAAKSTDGGQTWTHIRNSDMQRDCPTCGGDSDDFRYCMSLAIDPSDSDIVYVGTGGPSNTYTNGAIYKTTDGGATWEKMNGGNTFGFNSGGNYKNDYSFSNIVIDSNNPLIIYASTSSNGADPVYTWWGTVYRSEDGGNTWKDIFYINGDYDDLVIKPDNSNSIFSANNYGLFRHYYDGSQWQFEYLLNYSSWPPSPGEIWARRVRSLAFDPNNSDVLYAVWKNPWAADTNPKFGKGTTPYGDSNWEINTIDYAGQLEFLSIAAHPADSEVVFAGDISSGIFKSTDQGQTWTAINNGVNAVIVYDVAVDPNDKTHIIAGTISGVYEKKGPGNWTQILTGASRMVRFHPADSKTIFAGQDGFLAKSTDSGQNWTSSNQLNNGSNYVTDIAVDTDDPFTIFISVNGYGIYGKIYRSTDAGTSFNEVLDGENQGAEKYGFNTVVIDPSDSERIFAGGGNYLAPEVSGDLWVSTDGGDTWDRTSLKDTIVNALLINPDNPDIMYAGTGYSGGTENPLYRSTDGGDTWTPAHTGIPTETNDSWNSVTDLAFHKENNDFVYAATGHQGIYISHEADSWLHMGTPEYDIFSIAISSVYAATEGGLLQLSGTGVIAGKVTDADSHDGISNAIITNDLGASTSTVDGEYLMVSPAGICEVKAEAENHSNVTKEDVTVQGGNVTWLDITMETGTSEPEQIVDASDQDNPVPDNPQEENKSTGGGKACFVATAAYGSPMAGQVELLRNFRDRYLLPYDMGRQFVAFYYKNGKPAAEYIDAHSWLKPPVRAGLYPLVGLAWLLVASSVYTKTAFAFCMISGIALVIIKKRK